MTNVHTCMHICAYFCDLGPFGTHPPFDVQKYTWHFCVLGENIDTPPRLYKSKHVTFVFLKNMDPPDCVQ